MSKDPFGDGKFDLHAAVKESRRLHDSACRVRAKKWQNDENVNTADLVDPNPLVRAWAKAMLKREKYEREHSRGDARQDDPTGADPRKGEADGSESH